MTYQEFVEENRRDWTYERRASYEILLLLEAQGVVSTPKLFWYAGCGKTLAQAVRDAHDEEMWKESQDAKTRS